MSFETPPPPPPPPPPPSGPPPFGPPSFGPPSFEGPGIVQRPPRPNTVTFAVGLMITQIALGFIGMLVPFLFKDGIIEAYRRMPVEPGAPTVNPETQFYTGVGTGACGVIIVAIAFGVLAVFLLKGNNVARIITWVLAGISLCCNALAPASLLIVPELGLPGGYITALILGTVLSVIITIIIIVLLALPKSNAFFKPKQPGQLY